MPARSWSTADWSSASRTRSQGKPNSRRIAAGSNPVEISFAVLARSIRVARPGELAAGAGSRGCFDPLRRFQDDRSPVAPL
jgi:hypothetical protein